jgi:hypothetical protein
MDYLQAIEAGIKAGVPYHEIARKIYITYPTSAFVGAEEQQFEVLNEISVFFGVPISCIHIAGSAKTGRSFHKKRDFIPGVSDLDVAIVDTPLFVQYMEIVFTRSKGYFDRSTFPIRRGSSTYEEYVRYLSRGIFRPDLMTICPDRAHWNDFFTRLSDKHNKLFKSINAAIYLSQSFFESKQRSTIKSHIENRPI